MAKKFIPTNAGMTKKDIAQYLNEECEMFEVDAGFKPKDLSDAQCQTFVDELEDVRDSTDMIFTFIYVSLGRKDLVKQLVENRGW